jgi:hypothetical protein
VTLTTTPSTDGATGSGVATYQFTADGGATILAATTLTRPGTYTVQARAIDVAGNASAWSLPIEIVVPAGGSGGAGGRGGVLHLARLTVDGQAPDATATINLTRTWGAGVRVVGTVDDALGAPAAGARVIIADAGGLLAQTTTGGGGQFAVAVPVRRSGTLALTADGGGTLVHIGLRLRPLLRLTAAERRSVTGQPLRLGARRVITISGTAVPTPLVAGRPIQLEYLRGRVWLPLGMPATIARNGGWRVRYAVTNPGHALVDLRVVLPTQPGLPFAAGVSPVVKVAIH